VDAYLRQLGSAIDQCLWGESLERQQRVRALGEMVAANIPFRLILQKYQEFDASLDFVLADLVALGVRPELFMSELQNCAQWLGQRQPPGQHDANALQAASTVNSLMQTFQERSSQINLQFAREQAQRDYVRWMDTQLARNWVLSFMGQSGDPILRSYPGMYGA
jgi:hypothetical protein